MTKAQDLTPPSNQEKADLGTNGPQYPRFQHQNLLKGAKTMPRLFKRKAKPRRYSRGLFALLSLVVAGLLLLVVKQFSTFGDLSSSAATKAYGSVDRGAIKDGKKMSLEEIEDLLGVLSPLRGPNHKHGMLDPEKWLPEYEDLRIQRFRKWEKTQLQGRFVPQPSFECQVLVNHHYRFFWIKTRKTAGSSLRESLGWICDDLWNVPSNANMSLCSDFVHKGMQPVAGSVEEWWKDYFVFGFTRNLYARFASAQEYISRETDKCPQHNFSKICQKPFLQARGCVNYACCYPKRNVKFVAEHMMEQSSCFFTKEGKSAVDFIGHTEMVHEDFPIIAAEINKRRKDGVPPLSETTEISRVNSHNSGSSAYAQLYKENPECIEAVTRIYASEHRDMKYAS